MTGFAKSLTLPATLIGALASATTAFAESTHPIAEPSASHACTIQNNVLTFNVPYGDAEGSTITIDLGADTDRPVTFNGETLILKQEMASPGSAALQQAYGEGTVDQAYLANKGIFDGYEDHYKFVIMPARGLDLSQPGQFLSIGLPDTDHIDHVEFTTTIDGRLDGGDDDYRIINCTGETGQLALAPSP